MVKDNIEVIKLWILEKTNLGLTENDIYARYRFYTRNEIYDMNVIYNRNLLYYSSIFDKFESEKANESYQTFVRKHKLKRILEIEI